MSRRPDQARRRQIAARAFELIRSRGVHRTRMSDIATALGMKRPTLYWYFKNLGEIFDAIVGEIETRWQTAVAAQVAATDDPIDALQALVATSTEFNQNRRQQIIALFQLWAISATKEPESIIAQERAVIEPLRAQLVARMHEGISSGQVAPCEPEQIVDLVFAVVDGAMVHQVLRGTDLDSTATAVSKHILEPLRRTPPTGRRY